VTEDTNQSAICYLCGQPIDRRDDLDMDHVPPKQFYPKEVRESRNLNLWRLPTHKRCNGSFSKDEDYFYVTLFALVSNAGSDMAHIIQSDISRRAAKPQTRAIARRFLKTVRTEVDGIHLPPGTFAAHVELSRIERVAIKITRGLSYRDHKRYLPVESCKDFRICLREDDVPEFYRLYLPYGEPKTVVPEVLFYKSVHLDNIYTISLFLWQAFMIGMTFESTAGQSTHGQIKRGD
jgi:hypothetical protein